MHLETKCYIECTDEEVDALRHAHHMIAIRLGNRHETLPSTISIAVTPAAARAVSGLLTMLLGKPQDDVLRTKPDAGIIPPAESVCFQDRHREPPDLPAHSAERIADIISAQTWAFGNLAYKKSTSFPDAEYGLKADVALQLGKAIAAATTNVDITITNRANIDNQTNADRAAKVFSDLSHAIEHMPRDGGPTRVLFTAHEIACAIRATDPTPLSVDHLVKIIQGTVFQNASPISMMEWSAPDIKEPNAGWRLARDAAYQLAQVISIHLRSLPPEPEPLVSFATVPPDIFASLRMAVSTGVMTNGAREFLSSAVAQITKTRDSPRATG